MKYGFVLSAIALQLFLSTCLAAPAARKSADGLDLPAASIERKLHPRASLGGTLFGARPEDAGRVFNTKKSATLLAKHTSQDLGCDWFVINFLGADVAGLTLTDGRISKVILFYESANPTKTANLHKQVDGNVDPLVKVTFRPIEQDKKHGLIISFEMDAIEFYLAIHSVDPKIADAMRQHRWTPEMTDEQALMIGDGPGKYLALFGSDTKSDGTGAGTVFADAGGPDIRMEFEARNKQDAREQALKKHKNLKELTKLGAAGDGSAAKK